MLRTPGFMEELGTPATSRLDRRLHPRYPINLRMEYKLICAKGEWHGFGKTINLSSGGALFLTDGTLPTSSPVELLIDWPVLLDGSCALRLVVRGVVVRADHLLVAVSSRFHEFRVAAAGTGLKGRKDEVRSAVAS